jgi:hypothetical protein
MPWNAEDFLVVNHARLQHAVNVIGFCIDRTHSLERLESARGKISLVEPRNKGEIARNKGK